MVFIKLAIILGDSNLNGYILSADLFLLVLDCLIGLNIFLTNILKFIIQYDFKKVVDDQQDVFVAPTDY